MIQTGSELTVDDLIRLDEINHWNPELRSTSFSTDEVHLGDDGLSRGAWWRSGNLIVGWCWFRFLGNNINGTMGTYLFINPPVSPDLALIASADEGSRGHKVGSGRIRDQDTPSNSIIVTVQFYPFFGGNDMWLQPDQGRRVGGQFISWANNDAISVYFTYPADERLLD